MSNSPQKDIYLNVLAKPKNKKVRNQVRYTICVLYTI